MKKIPIIALAAAVIAGFLFIMGGTGDIANYPPDGDAIVMFGDSLVEGVGATRGNDLPSLISRGLGLPVGNLGVSGNTTADGAARIDELLKSDPDIAIILLGGNDALRKVPIEETEANLRQIVSAVQARGAVVLLLGVRGGILNDPYDDMYERIAEDTGSAHVSNVLKGLFADSRYMADAIHPNDQGYAMIAERVIPVVRDLLP